MRAGIYLVSFFLSLAGFAGPVGPEIPVDDAGCAATQENVAISRDSGRTLMAFEESAGQGTPSRVVVHRYESMVGPWGRATFAVASSAHHQRRPAFGKSLIAWVEEESNGATASLWWQALDGYATASGSPRQIVGGAYQPLPPAERVAEVAPGTSLEVLNNHVFHVMVWTAPDGRLKAAMRSLIARIGYDPSPFYVTTERAFNPSAGTPWSDHPALIAYNYEIPGPPCEGSCTPVYGIRARALYAQFLNPAIEIAPPGASAPRTVFNGDGSWGSEYAIFWSMPDGGVYARRVMLKEQNVVPLGETRRVGDGAIHDASVGPNREYYLALERDSGLRLLRLDRQLGAIEDAPFTSQRVPGQTVSISGDHQMRPMLAYAAQPAGDCSQSRAVFRAIDLKNPPRKARAFR